MTDTLTGEKTVLNPIPCADLKCVQEYIEDSFITYPVNLERFSPYATPDIEVEATPLRCGD
ncbi:hypothetical protein [Klebsiella aerogenes]|uniref:Uncharacterized protein n=1 Tax=Klebsiella aerogenes TaxID=548 RepID=A0AAP9QX18_KLEAE|nr:hypothetical protein [Klebsiella aerogenes]QMR40347.1 hypothetical protein HV331_13010 [Klebsiella aerogenes]